MRLLTQTHLYGTALSNEIGRIFVSFDCFLNRECALGFALRLRLFPADYQYAFHVALHAVRMSLVRHAVRLHVQRFDVVPGANIAHPAPVTRPTTRSGLCGSCVVLHLAMAA